MDTGNKSFLCPVCGKYEFEEFGDFDICPVCDWENDFVQNQNPDITGGANTLSLNQARLEYMLLSNPLTQEQTKQYQKEFYQEYRHIRQRFDIKNYTLEQEKAEQQRQAFISAIEKYIENLFQMVYSVDMYAFVSQNVQPFAEIRRIGIDDAELNLDPYTYLVMNQDETAPFSGISYLLDEKEQKYIENYSRYLNGFDHGEEAEFYPDGTIKSYTEWHQRTMLFLSEFDEEKHCTKAVFYCHHAKDGYRSYQREERSFLRGTERY